MQSVISRLLVIALLGLSLIACSDDKKDKPGESVDPSSIRFSDIEGIWRNIASSDEFTFHFTRLEHALERYSSMIPNAERIKELVPLNEPVLAISEVASDRPFFFQSLWRLKVNKGQLELELMTGDYASNVSVPISSLVRNVELNLEQPECQICPIRDGATLAWHPAQPMNSSPTGWSVRSTSSAMRSRHLYLGASWTAAGDLLLFSDHFGLGGPNDHSWRGELHPRDAQPTHIYSSPDAGRMAVFMPWGERGVQWVGYHEQGIINVGRLSPDLEEPEARQIDIPANDVLSVRRRSDDELVILIGDLAYESIGGRKPLDNLSRHLITDGATISEEPLPQFPVGEVKSIDLSPKGRAFMTVQLPGPEAHIAGELATFIEDGSEWRRVEHGEGHSLPAITLSLLLDDGSFYGFVDEDYSDRFTGARAPITQQLLVRVEAGEIVQSWPIHPGLSIGHAELAPDGTPWFFGDRDGYHAMYLDQDDTLIIQRISYRDNERAAFLDIFKSPMVNGTHIKARRHAVFGPDGGALLTNGYDEYILLPPRDQRAQENRSVQISVENAPSGAELVIGRHSVDCTSGCEIEDTAGMVHLVDATIPTGWILDAAATCESPEGPETCEIEFDCHVFSLDRGRCAIGMTERNLNPSALPAQQIHAPLTSVTFTFSRSPVLMESETPLAGTSFIAQDYGSEGRFAALMYVYNTHTYPDGTQTIPRGEALNAPVLTTWQNGSFLAAWALPPELEGRELRWAGDDLYLLNDSSLIKFDGASLRELSRWELDARPLDSFLAPDGGVWSIESIVSGEMLATRYSATGDILGEASLEALYGRSTFAVTPSGGLLVSDTSLDEPLGDLALTHIRSDGRQEAITLDVSTHAGPTTVQLRSSSSVAWLYVANQSGLTIGGEAIGPRAVIALNNELQIEFTHPVEEVFDELGGLLQNTTDGSWMLWGRGLHLGAAYISHSELGLLELIEGNYHDTHGIFGFSIEGLHSDNDGRLFINLQNYDRVHLLRPAILGGTVWIELDPAYVGELPNLITDVTSELSMLRRR